MDSFKQIDQKCTLRKTKTKKQVGTISTLGEVETTSKLGGTESRAGLCGFQNWVREGGLGGPRNTTLYLKNG